MRNSHGGHKTGGIIHKVLLPIISGLTAVALAVVCALFAGVSKPADGFGGTGGEVAASTTVANYTGNAIKDAVNAGTLKKNDIINYDYTGSAWNAGNIRSVVLPKGTFTLEVWGAQGGTGCVGGVPTASDVGGQGGYSRGTLTLTAETTIYIVIGGRGRDGYGSGNPVYAGGYNGGGTARGDCDSNGPAGSGGGATHIATASGLLSSLNGNRNAVLIVAGGGGGGGSCNGGGAGGHGGGYNMSGANGTAQSGYSAKGGTQTAGGQGSRPFSYNSPSWANGANTHITNTYGTQVNGLDGSFGQGGHGGGPTNDSGAGGGGGWFGGGGGAGRSGGELWHSAAGGSGYVNTSRLTNPYGTLGGRTGNGYARITINELTKVPETKNAVIATDASGASITRGTAKNIPVRANVIARDPDGSPETAVYFTNGAANADTVSTGSNVAALYLDAACTISASNYIGWNVDSADVITINTVKMYPRAGVASNTSTVDGDLVLYARVRDNFGTAGLARTWSVIKFTLRVAPDIPTAKSATTLNGYNTAFSGQVFLGTSEAIPADGAVEDSTAEHIYNPNGAGRYTVLIRKPLQLLRTENGVSNLDNIKVTVKASDLLNGIKQFVTSDNVRRGDKAIIALPDVSKINANDANRLVKVCEYDDNASVVAYGPTGSRIPNAFESISLVGVNARNNYQTLTAQLYVVESSSARGANYQFPGVNPVALDIIFKVDNTRPVLNADAMAGKAVELNTLQTTAVDLNDYFTDADDPVIGKDTHRIAEVVVPQNEFIQLDKYGALVNVRTPEKVAYYNIAHTQPTVDELMAAYTFTGAANDVYPSGTLSGSPTGFKNSIIATGATADAFVMYSFSGATLNLTGLRATYNMYREDRTSFRPAISGGISGVELATDGEQRNAGDFYILIRLQDLNDTSDMGIWLPLAIKVKNAAPTETSTERGQQAAGAMPTASGRPGSSFYFTPMGITVERQLYPLGSRKVERPDGTVVLSNDVIALASDADNFFTSSMTSNSKLNELVTVTSSASDVQSKVDNNEQGDYFSVAEEPIYIPASYFGGRLALADYAGEDNANIEEINGESYVRIAGLKVTLNNWTHNRYLYAPVEVTDSARDTALVYIAVNVENSTPTHLANSDADGSSVAEIGYSVNGRTVSSSYKDGVITYNIPVQSTVIITPYDLLTDANMAAFGVSYPEKGFTLNGLSGAFAEDSGTFTVGATAGENTRKITGLANSDNTKRNRYDYSSSAYLGELQSTLKAISGTRSFGYDASGALSGNNNVSADNAFSQPVAARNVGIDRLYFERSNDGDNLDGFAFDPYPSTPADFARPVVANDSYVKYWFGSKLVADRAYDLDFLVIQAAQRTSANASVRLTLNVRDRTGAGYFGAASGVTQITVVINVVNSTPYVKDEYRNKVFTLAVSPKIEDGELVAPSTLVINAETILADNEGDYVAFRSGASGVVDGYYTLNSQNVLEWNNSADPYGNSYAGNYINVSVTAQEIIITALNSTQNIPNGLFITFNATDGRSSTEASSLMIQVEVLNTPVEIDYSARGFEKIRYDDMNPDNYYNMWTVSSRNDGDKRMARYFAADSESAAYLKDAEIMGEGFTASDSQIKTAIVDSDKLQRSVLMPVTNPQSSTHTYINVRKNADGEVVDKDNNVITYDDKPDYSHYVPYAAEKAAANAADPVAVYIKWLTDGSVIRTKDYVTDYDIIYFVKDENGGVTKYLASQLRDGEGKNIVNDNPELFFDEEGRWKIEDWAIYVKPNNAFPSNTYFQLGVMVRDDSVFGGDTANIATGFDGLRDLDDAQQPIADRRKVVNGFSYLAYQLFVKDTGIISLDYYDNFDGYYTVADGADAAVNYVSTYDGDSESIYTGNLDPISIDGNKFASGAGTVIKSRNAGDQDYTFAGTNSGAVYNGGAMQAEDLAGAFKYTRTIEISGERIMTNKLNTNFTYIPMSYFALKKDLVSPNASDPAGFKFPTDSYISYNIGTTHAYNRSDMNSISRAITISDGTESWSGDRLASNPYVNITAYDAYSAGNCDTSNPAYIKSLNDGYFNKNLAISPINSDGTINTDYIPLSVVSTSTQAKNLVGNGHLMYLSRQTYELQENMFGIGISKKDTRSSSTNLTLTVEVAQCQYVDGGNGMQSGTVLFTSADEQVNASMYQARIVLNLHIGNAPVKLDESSVKTDANGYYVDVELTNGDNAWNIDLARMGVDKTTQARTTLVRFNDDDVVTDNGVIDQSKSDNAYFYQDSLAKFSKWSAGRSAYSRPIRIQDAEYDSEAAIFLNTSRDAMAQASLARYFGKTAGAKVSQINGIVSNAVGVDILGDFQPNGGMYGSNMTESANSSEGYSGYFGVAFSENYQRISITPYAKTVINYDAPGHPAAGNYLDESTKNYYAARGLVVTEKDVEIVNNTMRVKRAYYPLRVLIYDNCGSGWEEGSYVSLEIRVYIADAKPELASGLDDTDDGKALDISLAVGSEYRINVSDLISDSDLIAESGQSYWKTSYDAVKNKPDRTAADNFRLETRDYFVSPYHSFRSTDNDALRSGRAGFSDGQCFHNSASSAAAIAAMPDVIMYMDMGMSVPALSEGGNYIPGDNTIVLRVNRRTVYESNGVTVAQNDFVFRLTFTDSAGLSTETLQIRVHVTNQAPTLRSGFVKSAVKMRVGDSFTLLTAASDEFFAGTTSASSSLSNKNYADRMFKNAQIDGLNGSTGGYRAVLTSANLTRDEYCLRDYTRTDATGKHLGYYAVASDDTPWAMRIESISTNKNYFDFEGFDLLPLENGKPEERYALNYVIKARQACSNVPLTVAIIDGDGGRFSYTMYLTVESTVPQAIMYENESMYSIADGLYRTDDSVTPSFWGKNETKPLEFGNQQPGVFRLFMNVCEDESDLSAKNVTILGGRTVQSYGKIKIDVERVAYDPDKADNDTIALYDDKNTPKFTLDGIAMKQDDSGRYVSDRFVVEELDHGRSFSVTCTSFDTTDDYAELSFYVRDGGNDKLENALPVTIVITTLYAPLTNNNIGASTSMVNGSPRLTTVDKVFVKPIDTYLGNGMDPDDEDYAKIGEASVFRFLNYAGMPDAVDQDPTKSGARIVDPDVAVNTTNLAYDVRVYALMKKDADHKVSAMSLEEASAMFDINRNEGYFRLKNRNDVSVSNYLVGGVNSDGRAYPAVDYEILAEINKYFEFSVGADGVSIELRPVTATDPQKPILFYVEVEKTVGVARSVLPAESYPACAGSIFYVEVKDSAPLANTYAPALSFSGKVGESAIFPIFDLDDPYASLFTDSDQGDFVVVNGFDPQSQSVADYDVALREADCDWKGGRGTNKTQAISILINNTDEDKTVRDGFNNNKEYTVPAGSLMVNINRRIDVVTEDGTYLEKVELPVIIAGVDRVGEKSEVRLSITIENSDFTVSESALGSVFNDRTGVGHTFSRGETDKEFNLDVYVSKDAPALTLDVNRWLDDPDFTSVLSDTESFRLVRNALNEDKYLFEDELDVLDGADGKTVLATIKPNFTDGNKYKFEGITVTAQSYLRDHSGYVYIRVLDRSGSEERLESGVTITVNVHVLNSAPVVLDGKKEIEISVVGSKSAPTVILDAEGKNVVTLAGTVTDPNPTDTPENVEVEGNNTYLRIVSIMLPAPLTINASAEGDVDNILVVEQGPNLQSLVITANQGAYGTQSVVVTVADGDLNDSATRTASFTVTVTVIYDFNDITEFKTVNTMRGMTEKITVDALIAEIPDSANSDSDIAPLALGSGTFNPGAGYTVTGLSAKASDVNYVNISRDSEGVWQFRALRVTSADDIMLTAEFKLTADLDKPDAQVFKHEFPVHITDNPKPVLRPEFESDDGYTFYSGGSGSMVLNADGNVQVTPGNLFTDNEGDIMSFVSASSNVPSLVTTEVIGGDNLKIHFNAKGSAYITVTVSDLTGENITRTFKVVNIDLPEPTPWLAILVSFETNTLIWIIAFGALLLIIIFIIILAVILKRRKRKREELEAMLVSEMELEEQIMRLSAASPYASYGALPPTVPVQNDPGLMLGGGAGTPETTVIGLNSGTGTPPPDGGVPPAGGAV